ncbi:hypothetical protein ACH5RR_019761 [Cinchona calisaya]|uniref:Uncharacterized protein n=1 Tax=Cinchona calisaya TaxID=153742 RepID=A0ABD2ZTW1_9GENT
MSGRPCQYCDLVLLIEKDLQLVYKQLILHSVDYDSASVIYFSQFAWSSMTFFWGNLYCFVYYSSLFSIMHFTNSFIAIVHFIYSFLAIMQFIELCNVKLSMIGHHQLKNAATATCAALCLHDQGWKLSNESIRAGLEAHTKESARALANTIEMSFPKARIVLLVAMTNDKDHIGFARELLSARYLEAVFFAEASIAGEKSRTTSACS